MYGKKRVVLASKLTRSGNRVVAIKGGKSSIPLGLWYQEGGRYYADLKSGEQLYRLVRNDELASKRVGGVASQQALREVVMAYYQSLTT